MIVRMNANIINLLPPAFQNLFKKLFSILPPPIDNVIIPIVVALLIIWLVYRIQNRIRLIITREFLNNFPSIKRNVENLAARLQYLDNRVRELEDKLNKYRDKAESNPTKDPAN